MSKIFNIVDNTPLFDGKLFHLILDSIPGVTSSLIERTENGVVSPPAPFVDVELNQLTINSFEEGDMLHVRYSSAEDSFILLKAKAEKATKSKTLSNGHVEAGYLSDNGTAQDNSEPFVIPGGVSIGFGDDGSSGEVFIKGTVSIGEKETATHLTKLWDGEDVVNGAPPSDFAIGEVLLDIPVSQYPSMYLGSGALTQAYQLNSEPASDTPYYNSDEEVSLTISDFVFDGENTVVNVLFSEHDTKDSVLFDILDSDSGDSFVGRFSGFIDPSQGGKLFLDGNVAALLTGANYKVAALANYRFKNSFSIGNKAHLTKNNQIWLGTTGLNGTIETDYDIKTSGVFKTSFHGIIATSTLEAFFAVANTGVAIQFDTVIEIGGFTHTPAPFSELTCVVSGLYELSALVSVEEGAGALELWFEVDDGSGYSTIQNTVASYLTGTFNNTTQGATFLQTGDKIRLMTAVSVPGMSQAIDGSFVAGNVASTNKLFIKRIAG